MKNIKTITEDTLISLGIPVANKGFFYIVQAVPNFHERNSMMEVYNEVAKNNNDICSRVERTIRHSFSSGNKEKMSEYFGMEKRNNENLLAILNLKIRREIENES